MASHSQNIENLRTATYGEQVRGSMIELFEEDYDLVKKGISVGTDVTSAESSVEGYVDGNVYINSDTLDIWKTDGEVWDNVGNLKGIEDISVVESTLDAGSNIVTITLTDGTEYSFTVKNGSRGSEGVGILNAVDDGSGKFHFTKSDGTNTGQIQAIKGDKGDKGDTGNTGATGAAGRGVTSITSADAGKNHVLSANYTDGTSSIITTVKDGNDGGGGGDMYKATYDINNNGIVDYAEAIKDSQGNTLTYAQIANKAEASTTLAGYGITDAYTDDEVDTLLEGKADALDIIIDSVNTDDLTIDSDKELSLNSSIKNNISTMTNITDSDTAIWTSGIYSAGTYKIKDNKLYRAKGTTSSAWVAAEWEEVSMTSLKNDLANEYYKPGDTITIGGSSSTYSGVVTGASKYLYFTVPFKKKLDNVSGLNITHLKTGARCNGDYVGGDLHVWEGDADITISAQKLAAQNCFAIVVYKNVTGGHGTQFSNYPVAVSLYELTATFY